MNWPARFLKSPVAAQVKAVGVVAGAAAASAALTWAVTPPFPGKSSSVATVAGAAAVKVLIAYLQPSPITPAPAPHAE